MIWFIISTLESPAETDDSSRSFHSLTQEEQEEFFKRIADRLAQIGDQIVHDYRTNEGAANAFPEEESSSSSVAWTTSSGASASASSAAAADGILFSYVSCMCMMNVPACMRSKF